MNAIKAMLRLVPGVLLCMGLAVAGDMAAQRLALPVPGAVLGLLAYLGWLLSGRGIAWSRPGGALLLRWIGAFIVPALVGLTAYAGVLAGAALPLAAILVTTTVVTALATALIFRAVTL